MSKTEKKEEKIDTTNKDKKEEEKKKEEADEWVIKEEDLVRFPSPTHTFPAPFSHNIMFNE
jgi:hypothetical protein